jgi:hypothetical protein
MRPDPLDKIKPDNPVYLIGSAVGIFLTLIGAYHTHFVMNGGRIYFTQKGSGLPGSYLTEFESYCVSGGILLAGIALVLFARRWRNR